jgi:hypothetical protein
MIEPVFANTKFNRRIDRFQRRGRSAATAHCDRRALMLASKVAAVAVADAAIGVAPLLFAGAIGELGQRPGRRRGFERAEQVRELGRRAAHAISSS